MTSSGDPEEHESAGLRDKIAGQAEDTIGRIADELIENPVINAAISRAFEARERVAQAQQSAMGALNIPAASDIEKLERRLRSVSRRLEDVEDQMEKIVDRLDTIADSLIRRGDTAASDLRGDRAAASEE